MTLRRKGARAREPAKRSGLRILVGVDFSPESLSALRAARGLARKVGGRVTAAHVRPFSNMRAAVVEERGDLLRGKAARLSAALESHYTQRLGRLRPPGSKEGVLLLRGAAADALCREAGRGYDLIVLGNRGRGRVADFLLGSTVQEAVARSPIPVLVIRLARTRSRPGRAGS